MTKRIDSIVAVTVAKYATMYIEANTPQEACEYARRYCDVVDYMDFEDSNIEVDSYENYATESEPYMDKIWVENGRTMTYDEYVDELNAQYEAEEQ